MRQSGISLLRRQQQAFPPEHQVTTVPERGWAGKTNGELLRLAQAEFDAFVTIDAGLPYQQHLAGFELGIVLLVASSNRLDALVPLTPRLLEQLPRLEPGQILRIGSR
jgi:hypothetical protein